MRERLYLRAGGRCEKCGASIEIDAFHVAHLRAHVNGGALVDENAAAWCAPCNLKQGGRDVPGSSARLEPRDWQAIALPVVIEQITGSKVATVAAAPGAGKTVFAGLVFREMRERGLVDRMVVVAPRVTLLEQWSRSLHAALDIELGVDRTNELRRQLGTVVTYQSLTRDRVDLHRQKAEQSRTLYVLDEVHHVGEPSERAGQQQGFARSIAELVGDVDKEIYATGVLNLSGTLWRSNRNERISTVRYITEPDGRLRSAVDYEITAAELIRQAQLRPVDLFKQGAQVDLFHLGNLEALSSDIADLDDVAAGRAAIRGLSTDAGWRDAFVGAVLDRLKVRRSDLAGVAVKALIVAKNQADAREYQKTADQMMRTRGLRPITRLAVSDEPAAQRTLADFKTLRDVGVLCTVDMAGEGYDCPEIAVVGFASNKLTPLYVRQVVARAQRVTNFERQPGRRPIPAAVVIPDVPELVDVMSQLLAPMRHELPDPGDGEGEGGGNPVDAGNGGGGGTIPMGYTLDGVSGIAHGDVHVTGDRGGDVEIDVVTALEPYLREQNLPESGAPRTVLAFRNMMEERQTERPFDPLTAEEQRITAEVEAPATPPAPSRRRLTIEEQQNALQHRLGKLGRWWAHNGPGDPKTRAAIFNGEINQAAGIAKGKRKLAQVDQLERAVAAATRKIEQYCRTTGLQSPGALNPDEEVQ